MESNSTINLIAKSLEKGINNEKLKILDNRTSNESAFIIIQDTEGNNFSVKIQPY